MCNIGVLISGRGTNLQAIINAVQNKQIHGIIGCVISNRSKAFGIERAKLARIPHYVIKSKDYETREKHDEAIMEKLEKHKIDLIVLAGYMRILTPKFVNNYPHAIINLHPALLPSFPGLHGQRQAIEHGVKVSGCTVHFVDENVDHGPIILQTPVQVVQEDTEETLAARIAPHEHHLIVKAVRLWCDGRLHVDGKKVLVKPQKPNKKPGK